MKNVHSSIIMDVLEAEILSGDISPGARLSEQGLAQRFGVSRTPVREALQSIVSRSLADRVPYKGVVVRELDEARVQGMFEAMAEIEALCGGFAAMRMTDENLQRLRQTHAALSEMVGYKAARDYEVLNSEFHGLIYQFSGNEDLANMAFDMRLKLAPFRKSQLSRLTRMQESMREHALIVELFAMGNKAGVEQALRDHLMHAGKSFFRPRSD